MSNKDGILITNKGVYGLVNPPPAPSSKDAALPHQDISSAAVRWDTFVDLSNSGFSFTPANPTFMALIDKIPYSLGSGNIFYPLYQACQITFTQDQTFSKIKLWLKGRKGQLANNWHKLIDELPGRNMINNNPNSANWANNKIIDPNHPNTGGSNRDGMCNNTGTKYTHTPPPPAWSGQQTDTGIAHGITHLGHTNGSFDVWDISGPTTLGDPTNTGSTFDLYENISPNGWNLAWNLILTETAPDGTMKFLNQKGTWQTGQAVTGVRFYFNPQAYALVKGTNATTNTMGSAANFWVPPLTKRESTGAKDATNYSQVVHASWCPPPSPPCQDFYVIHSQNTGFVGDHLWYCENRCGYQFIGSSGGFPPPPNTIQPWADIPVTFKKGYSYLANISMMNVQSEISMQSGTTGPGLANVNALTYLELIV